MSDLSTVQIGDKVLVEGNENLGVRPQVGIVAGFTAKGCVNVHIGEAKYIFYANGHERTGDKWHVLTARPLTETDARVLALGRLQNQIAKLVAEKKGTLTPEQCQAILAILKGETA